MPLSSPVIWLVISSAAFTPSGSELNKSPKESFSNRSSKFASSCDSVFTSSGMSPAPFPSGRPIRSSIWSTYCPTWGDWYASSASPFSSCSNSRRKLSSSLPALISSPRSSCSNSLRKLSSRISSSALWVLDGRSFCVW